MATAIERVRSTVKWTSGTNLAAGTWLILAPFILGYSSVSAALWNDILIGLAVAALAWARVAKPLELEGAPTPCWAYGCWSLRSPSGIRPPAAALWMISVGGGSGVDSKRRFC